MIKEIKEYSIPLKGEIKDLFCVYRFANIKVSYLDKKEYSIEIDLINHIDNRVMVKYTKRALNIVAVAKNKKYSEIEHNEIMEKCEMFIADNFINYKNVIEENARLMPKSVKKSIN